ncbi:Uncharacterized protein FKW44_006856, partial [Caligus rogercresseyi]
MNTPDFRSYILNRMELAKTINEIHGDPLSTFPDSCPVLFTIKRWRKDFDNDSFAMEKNTLQEDPERRGHRRRSLL